MGARCPCEVADGDVETAEMVEVPTGIGKQPLLDRSTSSVVDLLCVENAFPSLGARDDAFLVSKDHVDAFRRFPQRDDGPSPRT